MLTQENRLVGVAKLVTSSGWTIRKHAHLFHEFIILYKGKLQIKIAGRTFQAGQGDILFYPEGTPHQEIILDNDPIETVYLGWEGFSKNWAYNIHDTDGRIRILAEWLYKNEQQESTDNHEIQQPFLNAVIAEFNRLSRNDVDENGLVHEARSFMWDRLDKPLTLDEIAEHLCISKFHFVRMYKKLTGSTPMRELQRMRARAARDMIITTDLPLKTIARKVGLTNSSHLSKTFKKYFNTPPVYYRHNKDSKKI